MGRAQAEMRVLDGFLMSSGFGNVVEADEGATAR